MSPWFYLAAQITLVAYAVVGGVFLAFSDFIMRSLSVTDSGAETMQVLNRQVFHWIFMALFLLLAPVSLALALYGLIVVGGPAGAAMSMAGLAYVIGCFGVTVRFNVPMNKALSELDAETETARAYWHGTYVPRWSFWNSVRTVFCIVASASLLVSLSWANWSMAT